LSWSGRVDSIAFADARSMTNDSPARAALLPIGSTLLVAAILFGCGLEPLAEPPVTIRMQVGEAAPAYGEAPWPTDALRDANGRLEVIAGLEAVTPTRADELARHLAATGGFGLRPLVELFLDGPIDPASLPPSTRAIGDAILVIDVEPGSPDIGSVVPFDWAYDPLRRVVGGSPSPGVVLASGRRYAAIATTALRSPTGPVAPAPELVRWLDGGGEPPARWRSTAEVARALTSSGPFDPETIAGVAVFTTQHGTRTLALARAILDDPARVPAPTVSFADESLIFLGSARLDALLGVAARDADDEEIWGWSNPTGIAHDHVGVIATGTMTTARFTRERRGDGEPDDETFAVDEATGAPAVDVAAHPIPVTIVLPAGPVPAAGFPVAIFGHGLGAGRHAVVTFAEPLTRAGFAVAAIDLADHGSRYRDLDEDNELAEIIADFSGDPALRDGFGDAWGLASTFALLRELENLSAVRDSFRQSVLDLCQLARLLRSAALDLSALAAAYGGEPPRLDARHIAYLGESYGAHVGTVFAAIEPEVDLYVLDVPGGGLLDLEIARSPEIGSLLIPFARWVYGFEGTFDRFHPLVAIGQAILDAADPLTYAPHVLGDRLMVGASPLGPRHVLVIEVVHDELIPNLATHALARAMGLPVLEPDLFAPADLPRVASPAQGNANGQSAALVEYAPATHGANWTSGVGILRFVPGAPHPGEDPFPTLPAPIEIENPLYETLEQVVEALLSHQSGAPPIFRSTLAPVADFDGDGVSDEEEIAMGRDPFDPRQ
jgi:dienelactone hydrolase